MDYAGKDYTASATVANPDVFSGSGVLVAQYLQAMTSRSVTPQALRHMLVERGGGESFWY